jgi:hypothetical protein
MRLTDLLLALYGVVLFTRYHSQMFPVGSTSGLDRKKRKEMGREGMGWSKFILMPSCLQQHLCF